MADTVQQSFILPVAGTKMLNDKIMKDTKAMQDQQAKLLADQQKRQEDLAAKAKAKEETAVQQSFAKVGNRRTVTGATLPGATPRETIGQAPNPLAASKTLIGA